MRETTHHRKDAGHKSDAPDEQRTTAPAVNQEPGNEARDKKPAEQYAAHQVCSRHVEAD